MPIVQKERKRLAQQAEQEEKPQEKIADHRVKMLMNHSQNMNSNRMSYDTAYLS